ncbi:MAG: hypothetical protein JNG89_04630 [Planctomycetaceae bacterium]|nr:hypothetical protein [Planctomycetaceae bacterium]
MTIAEALAAAEREPGRAYRCQVHGKTIEVRLVPDAEQDDSAPLPRERLLTKSLCDDDIMLDAWCELPEPKWTRRVRATRRERFMPDIPEIPRDDAEAE